MGGRVRHGQANGFRVQSEVIDETEKEEKDKQAITKD